MHASGAPPLHDDEEDDNVGVYLDESDVINVISLDDESLPDADDDSESLPDADDDSDSLPYAEDDDSHFEHEQGEDGDFIQKFTHHAGELWSAACSPVNETLVATGGRDDKGFLWQIGPEDRSFELQGHGETVAALAFSYDGERLASGSLDGIIKVWDLSKDLKCNELEGPGQGIEWLRWHPREHILLAGSEDSAVWMWDTDEPFLLNTFIGHGRSVTCGDFTPDGEKICTGSADATMRIWNRTSGEKIHVVGGHRYHTEGLTCLAIHSASTHALTGSEDGSVHIVHIPTGRVVDNNNLPSHSDPVECVGFAPSGSWAALGGMDNKLIIWDIEHNVLQGICEHEGGGLCLAWLGAHIATGCEDGKVRLWDCRSRKCVKMFTGHGDAVQSLDVSANAVQSLAVSANGKYLISASTDKTACVFEALVHCCGSKPP